MDLLRRSVSGAIFIIAIVVIRAIAVHKLPKRTFTVLWELVLLRLLIPFSIPSRFSVYTLIQRCIPGISYSGAETGNTIFDLSQSQFAPVQGGWLQQAYDTAFVFDGPFIWCVGVIVLAAFFSISYLRCRAEFRASLPACNAYAAQWLREHPLMRPLSIRQSDRVSAPLTYGIFHPVILMPSDTDWENTKQLQFIFMHEYAHVRRFDAATKLVMTAALCIHWFNPVVWIMCILFNRDMELSCDECVIRQFGETSRSAYAFMLIDMEAKKSGVFPLCSNFSKNAVEERMIAIMKNKKANAVTMILACVIIIGASGIFATSEAEPVSVEETASEGLPQEESQNEEKEDDSETAPNRGQRILNAYEECGLSYDKSKNAYFYDGKRVRLLYDNRGMDWDMMIEGSSSQDSCVVSSCWDPEGEIDLYTVREFDGEADETGYAKLEGFRVATREEFVANTQKHVYTYRTVKK